MRKNYFVYIVNNDTGSILRGYVAQIIGITNDVKDAKRFTREEADYYIKKRGYRPYENDTYSIVPVHRVLKK